MILHCSQWVRSTGFNIVEPLQPESFRLFSSRYVMAEHLTENSKKCYIIKCEK